MTIKQLKQDIIKRTTAVLVGAILLGSQVGLVVPEMIDIGKQVHRNFTQKVTF